MAKKRNKTYVRILFTCFILAGFAILFSPQKITNKLQYAFINVFIKPVNILRNSKLTEPRPQSISNVVEQSKYIRLRNHLANNIQLLREERENVEQLTGLRNRYGWKGVSFVLADVIGVFKDASRNEFIINRGKNDGLTEGQFVLGNESIIGTISDLGSHTARVKLLTDTRSRIAVKIGELDLQRIMQGNGDDSASIRLISIKYQIEEGDIVYAQKKVGFLDIPMITAIVVQCKIDGDNPLLWEIKVKPACNIKRLKNVTVIVMNPQEQMRAKNDNAAITGTLKGELNKKEELR